jgi:hypothetical protein
MHPIERYRLGSEAGRLLCPRHARALFWMAYAANHYVASCARGQHHCLLDSQASGSTNARYRDVVGADPRDEAGKRALRRH